MNVFLYEDTTSLRDGVVNQAAQHGIKVLAAYDQINLENAVKAIRDLYARGERLDLAVIDLWVQTGDGFSMFEKLRSDIPELKDVPLAIWSDASDPEALPGYAKIASHSSVDIVAKPADDEAAAIASLITFMRGMV